MEKKFIGKNITLYLINGHKAKGTLIEVHDAGETAACVIMRRINWCGFTKYTCISSEAIIAVDYLL